VDRRPELRSDSRAEPNHACTQKGREMSTLVRKQTGPKTGERYAQPPDRTARLFRQSELVFHCDQDEIGGGKFRSAFPRPTLQPICHEAREFADAQSLTG
jgi:hypothetical protein